MRTLGSTSIHKFYDDDEKREPFKALVSRFGREGDPTPTLGFEFDGHDVSISLHGEPNLERIIDLGYAIIAACQKLQPAPIDFGESLEANLPTVLPEAYDDGPEIDAVAAENL